MRAVAGPARRGVLRRGGGLLALTLLLTGLLQATASPAHAANEGIPPPEAFVLVDANTGSIITGRHMHEAIPPASTTKIMTALVAVERLPPGSRVRVSANAAQRVPMKIGMQAGTRWPLGNTLASMMMVSANDAAYALAEASGGSIRGFAKIANETATRLGMRDSNFGDPAGLSDETSYKGGPTTSAYDLALIFKACYSFPDFRRYVGTRTAQMPAQPPRDLDGFQIQNDNRLLFEYPGALGGKTGFTDIARHTFVGVAERDGRRLVVTLLGAENRPALGWEQGASLLDWGFEMAEGSKPVGRLVAPGEVGVPAPTPSAGNIAGGPAGGAGAPKTGPPPVANPRIGDIAWSPPVIVVLVVVTGAIVLGLLGARRRRSDGPD